MLCPLHSLLLLSSLCAFFFFFLFFFLFVFSLGTKDPTFPCYSCHSWCLHLGSGSNFSCLIRIVLSTSRVFFTHLFSCFSHSPTLIVIIPQFVLLPSVQLSHASIIKLMKSRLKNILLLKKLGIKFILLLGTVVTMCTCMCTCNVYLLPSVNCIGTQRNCSNLHFFSKSRTNNGYNILLVSLEINHNLVTYVTNTWNVSIEWERMTINWVDLLSSRKKGPFKNYFSPLRLKLLMLLT